MNVLSQTQLNLISITNPSNCNTRTVISLSMPLTKYKFRKPQHKESH